MKKTVFLICGVITLLFGLEANAQKPYNMDELYEIGKLSKGSISDFVSWMLAEPEDELNGPMSEAWQLYRKNKPLGKGTTIVLDEKNGYFRYELDYDKEYEDEEAEPVESITVVEMCVWNCADGKHKLFAENVGGTYQGKPHNDGQFDGAMFSCMTRRPKSCMAATKPLIVKNCPAWHLYSGDTMVNGIMPPTM